MHQSGSGAVTALIYHKGLLFSGYSDGSVKVCVIYFNKKCIEIEMFKERLPKACKIIRYGMWMRNYHQRFCGTSRSTKVL